MAKLKKRTKHEPISLRYTALMLVLIVGVFAAANVQRFALVHSSQLASVVVPTLVSLANQDREEVHINTLAVDPILTAAAQAKADDMAQNSYFAHTSPDGKSSWYWFEQVGYDFKYAGENLAVDFSDSVDVEKAWMDSPTHRANLLSENFTEIGIATARGTYEGRSTTFVVQMFGAPRTSPTPAAPVRSVTSADTAPTEVAVATTKDDDAVASSPIVLGNEITAAPTAEETTLVEMTSPDTNQSSVSILTYLLSSPKETMLYAYYLLAAFVIISLAARTGVEIQRHHMGHVAVTGGLLAVMSILFIVADILIFTDPVLAAVI